MDRFDLSRQAISSLAQVSDDIAQQVERSADADDGDEYEYALSLAQNRIIEVHAIGRFQHVAQLDLSSNKIVSLEGIQTLVRLESLNLARNNLTSVDVLASLPRLRVLTVAENSIVQLDGLRSCQGLVALDASYNNVTKWPRLGDTGTLESLDLSSNLLEAFAPSDAPALFPGSLRRLSVAKNQIHELCGVAALGLHLTRLQSLSVEGNVGVAQIVKSGGKLEYMLANLFPSLLLGGGAGSKNGVDPFVSQAKRELFQVPQSAIAAVQLAVLQQNEDALAEFLKTGTALLPSGAAALMTRKAVLASTIQSSRFKVEELMQPQIPDAAMAPATASPSLLQSAVDSRERHKPAATPPLPVPPSAAAAALSKESKMEMWKRITEERKAQQEKEKSRLQRELLSTDERTASSTSAAESLVAAPATDSPLMSLSSRVAARDPPSADAASHSRHNAAPLPPPPSPPIPTLRSASASTKSRDRLDTRAPTTPPPPPTAAKPLDTAADAPREPAAVATEDARQLSGQVQALSDQIATMRKYMKVWIKREQVARDAAARRIQRWRRQLRLRRAIGARASEKRLRRRERYSFQHAQCPRGVLQHLLSVSAADSTTAAWHLHAQTLQRCARGFLVRRRLRRWARLQAAASRIQRLWRSELAFRDEALRAYSRLSWKLSRPQARAPSRIAGKLVGALARLGSDVRLVQQVSVVYERAMVQLWADSARARRFLDYRIAKAVVRFQSLWRGYAARKRRGHAPLSRAPRVTPAEVERMRRTMEQQAQEVARLVQQVHALESAVSRLLQSDKALSTH